MVEQRNREQIEAALALNAQRAHQAAQNVQQTELVLSQVEAAPLLDETAPVWRCVTDPESATILDPPAGRKELREERFIRQQAAKRFCRGCSARMICLVETMDTEKPSFNSRDTIITGDVRGAMTRDERRQALRGRAPNLPTRREPA